MHNVDIKNCFYKPNSPVNILSVSELSKQTFHDSGGGTYIASCDTFSTFVWNNRKHTRTLDHPPNCMPLMPINEGFSDFSSFLTQFAACFSHQSGSRHVFATEVDSFAAGDKVKYCRDGHIVDATIDAINRGEQTVIKITTETGQEITTTKEFLLTPNDPLVSDVTVDKATLRDLLPSLPPSELDALLKHAANPSALDPIQSEWVYWHDKLGHLSPTIMKRIPKVGFIPRRLASIKKVPPCASCIFGRATKRSWSKTGDGHHFIRRPEHDKPGKGVSVDQLVSAQPGIIPQSGGTLTTDRIWGATCFSDHYSGFRYSHLMRNFTAEATIEAKQAFEKFSQAHGVDIAHYHADNGRFAEVLFRQEVDMCGQKITYCGVGAHHQNGIVERAIQDATFDARTLLLHAKRYWPEMISTALWPLAIKAADEKYNKINFAPDGSTPESRFTGNSPENDLRYYHTWGCPSFVLEHPLASGSKIPKWDPRARCGFYVGHSAVHAGSVTLILNPSTGHISPQFHVVFDDTFLMVPFMRLQKEPPNWADLVRNHSELATDEKFDVPAMWPNPSAPVPAQETAAPLPREDPESPFPREQHVLALAPAPCKPSSQHSSTQPSSLDSNCSGQPSLPPPSSQPSSQPLSRQPSSLNNTHPQHPSIQPSLLDPNSSQPSLQNT